MSDRPRSPASAPLRRCVVCRQSAPKSELLRAVRRPDGSVSLSQSADGRGAYIHLRDACLTAAASEPKRLERSLRIQLPEALIAELQERTTQIASAIA